MKHSHKAALACAAMAFAFTPASATHSWGGYHWARSTNGALSLTINTAVDSNWQSYVGTSIANWDNPVNDPYSTLTEPDVLSLTANSVTVDRRKCNPIAGQALVCNYAYGRRGWLGIASIWADGSKHITQATTKLNDSYYGATSSYNTPSWRSIVACQEVGHDFGLAHQDENFSNLNLGTCMDYTNNPDGGGSNGSKSNLTPNYHDYEELGIIYGHSDSYSTATSSTTNFGIREVGKAVPQPAQGVGDTMADWGTAVHKDGKGRPDVFVKLADGYKVITHVFWAPDAKGTEAR
ncbi:MAG TPA: hypothetical protein VFU91_01230 [Sphingomicrobium sp.]|jgi:hypothetical protein|nr:hypothetical protein [Sphingomicrobium sp.]